MSKSRAHISMTSSAALTSPPAATSASNSVLSTIPASNNSDPDEERRHLPSSFFEGPDHAAECASVTDDLRITSVLQYKYERVRLGWAKPRKGGFGSDESSQMGAGRRDPLVPHVHRVCVLWRP